MKTYDAVELRDPGELTPYAKNHKRHGPGDIDKLAAQIAAFGFDQPIVVDSHNVIIKGHKRRLAALQLGLKHVPTVRSELDENDAMAARIGDNHVITNEFDNGMLADDLGALQQQGVNMSLTGMDTDTIAHLMDNFATGGEPAPSDVGDAQDDLSSADAEADAEPTTQTGDLWVLGKHRLLCGDSTHPEAIRTLLKYADATQIDAVVTDPPYGVSAVGKNTKVGGTFPITVAKKGNYRPIVGDDKVPDVAWLLKVAPKVIVWGGNYFAPSLPASNSWLIWDKRCDSGIENTFADCELAWSNHGGPARVHRQLWNGMIRQGEHTKRVHPTQKPIAVMAWCLSFIKGSVIADPYCGSGSTLMACEQADRRCLASEIDLHYCDVIVKRWEELSGGQAHRHPNALVM